MEVLKLENLLEKYSNLSSVKALNIITMINTKHLYITLFLFFTSLLCSAQQINSKKLFRNIEDAVRDIKTVTYKINRTDKNFSLKDTLYYAAICSLKIVDTDKIGMHYNINQKLNDSTYTNHKYDGVNVSYIYMRNDSLFPTSFMSENAKDKNYAYVNNNFKFICREFFYKKHSFIQYKSSSSKKKIIKEVIYMEKPSYEITVIFKNSKNKKDDEITNMIEKYYIDKTTFLPIGYIFNGEYEGMKGYETYYIEYLEINPPLNAQNFKAFNNIGEIEKSEIQKYNL